MNITEVPEAVIDIALRLSLSPLDEDVCTGIMMVAYRLGQGANEGDLGCDPDQFMAATERLNKALKELDGLRAEGEGY